MYYTPKKPKCKVDVCIFLFFLKHFIKNMIHIENPPAAHTCTAGEINFYMYFRAYFCAGKDSINNASY